MIEANSRAMGRYGIVLIVGLLVVSGAFFLSTIPYGRAFHDLLVLLDGSYRISVGQTPHIDFANPIGPLLLYAMRAGEILFPSSHVFVAYHAVIALLFLPVFWILAPRFRCNWAFLASLGIFLLITLLPMTLDETTLSEISYFATYNRFGSSTLFLMGLWYVLPKRKFDGVMLAYLLILMAGVKITAAMVGIGILIAALILGRAKVRTGVEAAITLALSLSIIEFSTGMVSGYLSDIATMIALNESGGLYKLLYYGFFNWLVLGSMGLIVLAALWAFVRDADFANDGLWSSIKALWNREAFVVDMVLLVVAAWGAESQNTGGLGLIAGSAILFRPAAWRSSRVLTAFLAASMLFPVLDIAVVRTLKAVVRERVAAPIQPLESLAPGTRVPLSTYEGARFFLEIFRDKRELAREVQDKRFFLSHDPTSSAPAVQLARAQTMVDAASIFEEKGYRENASRYVSIIFADPFARMLKLTPAKGTMLTMDAERTVPRMNIQQASDYLSGADGVFDFLCDLTDERLDRDFKGVLESEFDEYPLNQCWTFYARKK